MKFLKRFTLLILLLALALFGIANVLPDSAHVERSVRIDAPPETVFPYLNNLRRFNEWAVRDPDAEHTFHGPDAGVGAQMLWRSEDPDVGSGSTLIVESRPPHRVVNRLELPDLSNATAYFEVDETGDGGSRVTWGFDTEFRGNLVARYFGLMLERWVGTEYERGLEKLKQLVEGQNVQQDNPQEAS